MSSPSELITRAISCLQKTRLNFLCCVRTYTFEQLSKHEMSFETYKRIIGTADDLQVALSAFLSELNAMNNVVGDFSSIFLDNMPFLEVCVCLLCSLLTSSTSLFCFPLIFIFGIPIHNIKIMHPNHKAIPSKVLPQLIPQRCRA